MTSVRTKRVLGAILNLIRYKPTATLEEANARLRLIDKIVLEALRDVEKPALAQDLRPHLGKRLKAAKEDAGMARALMEAARDQNSPERRHGSRLESSRA